MYTFSIYLTQKYVILDTSVTGVQTCALPISGHSKNSYTRYSAALLSSNDGSVGVPNGHGYDTYLTFSQAFGAGSLGQIGRASCRREGKDWWWEWVGCE